MTSTNWWYIAGMRLLLRINKCCCSFRSTEVMFPNPPESRSTMSAPILIGDRSTPRFRWITLMSIAGTGCLNTRKWECGLTIHVFLFPSMQRSRHTIQLHTDFQAAEPELSSNWAPLGVLAITSMSSAKALEFTIISPNCGSDQQG